MTILFIAFYRSSYIAELTLRSKLGSWFFFIINYRRKLHTVLLEKSLNVPALESILKVYANVVRDT